MKTLHGDIFKFSTVGLEFLKTDETASSQPWRFPAALVSNGLKVGADFSAYRAISPFPHLHLKGLLLSNMFRHVLGLRCTVK